jgi:hypothetical protein
MLLDGFAKLLASAMQMSPHGADGHAEDVGDLLVGALLLMIEDEDSSFDLTKALEVIFHGLLKLTFFQLLLGVAAWALEAVFPMADVVGEGDVGAIITATAFPLVLGDVDGDAVEVGGDERFTSEARESAVETEKDVLSEIVDVLAAAQ